MLEQFEKGLVVGSDLRQKTEFKRAAEVYDRTFDQQKANHDETSRVIRRVFLTLLGTCLFCVITLTGTPDAHMITAVATVELPVLNYEIGFGAFLAVGPIILISLTLYLHIFVGQLRNYQIPSKERTPMLPNFSGWIAQLTTLGIFYWMVPFTLATFAWKAWPRPGGPLLLVLSVVVALALVALQVRRCPTKWRPWAVPLLLVALVVFSAGSLGWADARRLNLFKVNLANEDLRYVNLAGAGMAEANLSGANLIFANLSRAYLSRANLTGVDLTQAKLIAAHPTFANLSEANLTGADLSGAYLIGANLTGTDLTGANLGQANLTEANLTKARLIWTDLTEANLIGADLSGVYLIEANLTGANLSGANLSGANVGQSQLDVACGNKSTQLFPGLTIPPCDE